MKRLIIGVSILFTVAATVLALKADAAAVISTPASSTVMNQLASPISPWLLRVNQTRTRPVTVAVSPVMSSQETALNSSTFKQHQPLSVNTVRSCLLSKSRLLQASGRS